MSLEEVAVVLKDAIDEVFKEEILKPLTMNLVKELENVSETKVPEWLLLSNLVPSNLTNDARYHMIDLLAKIIKDNHEQLTIAIMEFREVMKQRNLEMSNRPMRRVRLLSVDISGKPTQIF